jgi:hypothetical protein
LLNFHEFGLRGNGKGLNAACLVHDRMDRDYNNTLAVKHKTEAREREGEREKRREEKRRERESESERKREREKERE